MKVEQFIFNMFGVNTYVLWDEKTKDAIIIDPGMINLAEQNELVSFIDENELRITHTIYTHFHVDHTIGCDFIKSRYNLPVEGCADDEFLASHRFSQAHMFGLPEWLKDMSIDKYLREGDTIQIGDEAIEILHIPGHSPGSLIYYLPKSKIAFTGDVLFKNGIGRTDLSGGNQDDLMKGIKTKLFTLPFDTVIYPGHGPSSTIRWEVNHNPFF